MSFQNRNQPLNFNICHIAINDFHFLYDDLIKTIFGGLTDLGYKGSVSKNHFQKDAINILLGSTIFASRYLNLNKTLKGLPYIVYQLEPLNLHLGLIKEWPEYLEVLINAHAIWDYAPYNQSYLAAHGFHNVYITPPAYHSSIETLQLKEQKDIDILFYGSPHDRRKKVIQDLIKRDIKVVYVESLFGEDRNNLIRRAKIVLNIHAWYGLDVLETVRLSFLLANKCFIISENSDYNPYSDGVIFAPYESLVETCMFYLQASAQTRDEIASKGYLAASQIKAVNVLAKTISLMGEERLEDVIFQG
jgi:hypothetical protein